MPRLLDLFPSFGSHLSEFLEVGHNQDGTLKGVSGGGATPSLSQVLAAGADALGAAITGLPAPANANDAVRKAYVDALTRTLAQVLAAGADAGGSRITNLGAPAVGGDAATKQYVDSVAGVVETLASVLAAGHDANGITITNHGAPTNPNDVATKAYVDAATFNNQAADYTAQFSDLGEIVNFTGSAAKTFTIPADDAVAWTSLAPAVPELRIRTGGTGVVTVAGGPIAAGGTVTIHNPYSSYTLYGQWAEAKVIRIGPNVWVLNGEVA